ncbi:hypothetical protein, partial [Bradyrhizobium sp.]|uniref:hypothetical protein n=1 Tax=Bradyrhizobium sp. TaxID=376 RepID=UPI002DFB04E2|nr:hypothetical protein [Bradyrhizobium sp.]
PGGAAPYVTGRARLALSAAQGGAAAPSEGCLASILAPPAAPSRQRGSLVEQFWQTSDALRRENAEAWLFEILIGN